MVDITAKRGPIDPNAGNNLNGLWNQAEAQAIAAQEQYNRNKKSDWDRLREGYDFVSKVAKDSLGIYSGYQDIQMKDKQLERADEMLDNQLELQEEQISKSQLDREIKEYKFEQYKKDLAQKQIQASLALKKEQDSATWHKKYADFIANKQYGAAANLCLENPAAAETYSNAVTYTISKLLNMGNTEEEKQYYSDIAEQMAISCNPKNLPNSLQKFDKFMSGTNSTSGSVPNQEQYFKTQLYKDNVEAVSNVLFSSNDNATKLANLGLDPSSSTFDKDLLTCTRSIDTSYSSNDLTNMNKLIKTEDLTSQEASSYQGVQAGDIKAMRIKCDVDGEEKSEVIFYDPKQKILVNKRNNKGVIVGTKSVTLDQALSGVLGQKIKFNQETKQQETPPDTTPDYPIAQYPNGVVRTKQGFYKFPNGTILNEKEYEDYTNKHNMVNKMFEVYNTASDYTKRAMVQQQVAKQIKDGEAEKILLQNGLGDLIKEIENYNEKIGTRKPRQSAINDVLIAYDKYLFDNNIMEPSVGEKELKEIIRKYVYELYGGKPTVRSNINITNQVLPAVQ